MKITLKSIALLLWIITISCKNNAQEILTELPKELADKTWINIGDPEEAPYDEILKKLEYPLPNFYMKTGKNELHIILNTIETALIPVNFDKVIKQNNSYRIEFKNHDEIEYTIFRWKNRDKGIITLETKYLHYDEGKEATLKRDYINKDFVTQENFPEPKKPEFIIENEILEDISKYSQIDELPIKGKFICHTGNPGLLLLTSEKVNLYNSEGVITKVQPYEAQIIFDQYNGLDCSLRKIKGSSNKYALFFEHVTDATNNYAKDLLHYSKKRPIAEIEIIDNNTVKKKWIGLYNRRTKNIENYSKAEYLDWRDDCNGIVKRVH
ncbi:hypothetical protein [Aquimarina aquimarini]|uniref:hypothetical protein n=1 Tax=Aquimarina aquimarini TaxID=1191734 RepID=UPI000D55CA43|nr:hypothetical protein [Aquimarina aquimarini]